MSEVEDVVERKESSRERRHRIEQWLVKAAVDCVS